MLFSKNVAGLLLLVNEFRKMTQIALGPVTSNIVECVSGISSLRAFGAVPFQYNKFKANSQKYNVSLQHEQFSDNYLYWKGEVISILLFFVAALSIAAVKVLDISFLLNI